jgi:tetratricopeptide (TPR) repeat protein
MAMARRHHGCFLPSLLSLCAALVVFDPATALAVRRLESTRVGLAEAPTMEAPRRGLSDAARDLEEQAGALYGLGRYEEALEAQRQSVETHRRLVAQDPSQRLRLAASLHNLGVVLIRLGHKAEAIPPTAEALALYRSDPSAQGGEGALAQERPLRNLVLLLYESSRHAEALPLADDLVRLHPASQPRDPLAAGERIDVLNLRASLLVSLNRPAEAMRDLESAVVQARRMARQAPENPVLRHGLAGSLLNLSQVADLLGQFDQAVRPAREAEEVLRGLAHQHPGLSGDWAKALGRLGQAEARAGNPAKARLALERSIALLRTLDPAGPSRTLDVEVGGYRDDMAHALETLAVVQRELHQPEDARASGEEALRLYSALAQDDPRYQRDVDRTRAWLTTAPVAIPAQR